MKNMRLFAIGSQRVCLLLCALTATFLVSGCVGGKKTIGPYEGSTSTGAPSQQAAQPVQATGGASSDYARDVLMPILARIHDRISAYEHKLQSWQSLSSRTSGQELSPVQLDQLSRCRLQVTDLLVSYNQLQSQLLHEQSMEVSRRLVNNSLPVIEKKDISYLESTCQQLLTGCGYPSTPGPQSPASSVDAAMASGDYARVISAFESLSLAPGEEPASGMNYSYGVALMKSGREQEARSVFATLLTRVREQGEQQWEPELLKMLADLDFGLEDYIAARSRYEELKRVYGEMGSLNDWAGKQLTALDHVGFQAEEVRAYGALLLGYLGYSPQRDGFTVVQQIQAFDLQYPVSVVNSNVVDLADRAEEDAEKWFAGLLDHVDTLIAEQKKQEALLFIERISLDILPLDKQAILKLKKDALASSVVTYPAGTGAIQEEILQTTGPDESPAVPGMGVGIEPGVDADDHVPVTALQETWDQGMANMQAKEYDQAIGVFTGLLNTSYGTRAGLQIEEASRLAAQDARKEAAELFVRANRATDPDTRRELLLSSRVLLEDILQKYPQAGLDEKVRRNLSRIDQELATVEQDQGLGNEPVMNMEQGQF